MKDTSNDDTGVIFDVDVYREPPVVTVEDKDDSHTPELIFSEGISVQKVLVTVALGITEV